MLQQIIDVFLHLDVHLADLSQQLGPWLYVLLFVIVFCETGLVVTPFLPGDSLLFAAGALTAIESSGLNATIMVVTLIIAAVLGDALNYTIGYHVGDRIVASNSRWCNKRHVEAAEAFYKRHGGKAIIIARFAPILRTFAPFVAGIGRMWYRRFAVFNVVGGVLWVASFVLVGHWFGNLPTIKRNFHYVVVAIIVLSLVPVAVEFIRHRKEPPA